MFEDTVTKKAQRLAAQRLGHLPQINYHFSRKSKIAIQRSLFEPWPSRLQPRVGRKYFIGLSQYQFVFFHFF
jgi:hypothetical protein